MATLIELDQRGDLFKFDALELGAQEFRTIYASQVLYNWTQTTLPGMVSSWGIELSPEEQFVGLTEVFCSGETLTYGKQFKPLIHIGDGVWELKTPDLRIFGWFYRMDCFIGAVADDATRIKKVPLYYGYAHVTTPRFRDALDLDPPKYIAGDDPNAVVSNFDLP